MHLPRIKMLTESRISEHDSALRDAIMNEFSLTDKSPRIQQIYDYLVNNADLKGLDEYLYDHFEADMPYGTKKARDGDPGNWIADRMSEIFKGKH